MAYYNPEAETNVIVDASPFGLGAILSQKQKDSNYKPIAYGSRAHTPVEQRYSQTEREALAIAFGCTHSHFFIYDRNFSIIADHKSLLYIMLPTSISPPPRIQRWLLHITSPIRSPVKTSDADIAIESFINFITEDAIPKTCTIDEIEVETTKDKILQKVIKASKSQTWPKDHDLGPYRN